MRTDVVMCSQDLDRFSMTERGAEARRAPLAPRLLLGISLGGLHAHMAARPHAHGVNGYAHWDMITGEKEAAGDGLSVCEQLELEGSSHVGRATVFVIWNLGSPVSTLKTVISASCSSCWRGRLRGASASLTPGTLRTRFGHLPGQAMRMSVSG